MIKSGFNNLYGTNLFSFSSVSNENIFLNNGDPNNFPYIYIYSG